MRILLLTDGITPLVIGGMQRHSYNLAKYLVSNSVHVDLVHCLVDPNQNIDDLDYSKVFDEQELRFLNIKGYYFPKSLKIPGHYVRENKKLSCFIYEDFKSNLKDYDFIYAKGFVGWKFLIEKKKGVEMPPVGVNFHGYEMFQKPPSFKVRLEHLLLKRPVRWNSKNADYVFSYGGKITDLIVGLKVERKKIVEIPSGIDASWLIDVNEIKTQGERKFLFVGRDERRKGIKEINSVLKDLINESNYELEFHFVGPINNEVNSNKKVKIIYHGLVKDSQKIQEIMKTCHFIVVPSHSEGMPNVILEAMASGLAVIATDVGAVNKMVGEENGFLLNRPDPKLLKSAMIRAIKESDERLGLKRKNSINRVEKEFLWEKVIKTTIKKIKLIVGLSN